MLSKKSKKNKKHISVIVVSILLLISAVGFTWFKYQMKRRLGAFTEILNPEPYFERFTEIGIKNINILSKDASHFIPNQQLIIKNGIIEEIGDSQNLNSKIKYIDGQGKYLIPGLTDTHVHLFHSKNDLYLYLANGVTSVWEMFGNSHHLRWREEKENGAISPNLFVATQKLNSQKGVLQWLRKYFYWDINITSPDDVKKWLYKLNDQGYDALKIGSYLDLDVFDAILSEAKELGIPVMGHLPLSLSLDHLYSSGISQLAHTEEIMRRLMNDFDPNGFTYTNIENSLAYIERNADSVAKNLKENNIAVSSSLWLMESLPEQKFDIDNFIKTIELEYANPTISEGVIFKDLVFKGWLPGNNHYEDLDTVNDPKWRADYKRLVDAWTKANQIIFKAFNNNGVNVLAGTDTGATSVVPGFSLHDELESLVDNGYTNAQALFSATVAPAQFTGQMNGAIKTGNKADMVLLSKNPLEDINNTRSVYMVFINGYYMTKNHRKDLLEAVKTINNKSRTIDISQWISD